MKKIVPEAPALDTAASTDLLLDRAATDRALKIITCSTTVHLNPRKPPPMPSGDSVRESSDQLAATVRQVENPAEFGAIDRQISRARRFGGLVSPFLRVTRVIRPYPLSCILNYAVMRLVFMIVSQRGRICF